MTDLAFASIAELASRLAAKDLSPVEVTEATLARIEELEPQINAFITLTAESARHAARAAEAAILAGHYLGPLHGIPVGIKDLYATRGVATTFVIASTECDATPMSVLFRPMKSPGSTKSSTCRRPFGSSLHRQHQPSWRM